MMDDGGGFLGPIVAARNLLERRKRNARACKERAANSAALSCHWRCTAEDGQCGFSKAVKRWVRCDEDHCGRQGTRSASRVANAFKNRSSKVGSRKLPARDPQEREQGCRCNAYQRLHLLVAGLHQLRQYPWRPSSSDTIKRDFLLGLRPVSEAPPSATSHSDRGPAKQQGAAPRKSLAQIHRIAFCNRRIDPSQKLSQGSCFASCAPLSSSAAVHKR